MQLGKFSAERRSIVFVTWWESNKHEFMRPGGKQMAPLWASLIAQLIKNPPAMQESPVQFLGREEPLEKW